ncbi:MAG TPA: hypothetical protein VES40_19365 [Ilumatobacteraceae bacterium]|nr:hypothetical protein [Ilumatobacteraceae bacterium]
MNDDLIPLASAYLDGDVTADERARVEADPVMLGEVERLRYVRMLLADCEPSPISVRESLLANAMDAWDRAPAPPTSLADRRRVTTNRRLLGAAAALVLVLAGGVVLQTFSAGTDDESASLSASDETTPPEVAALAESTDDAGATLTADEMAPAPQLPAAATVPAGAELDTGINDAAPPTETDLEQLDTPEELGIFASDAVGAPQDPGVPAATSESIDERLTDEQAEILAAQWPLCLGADYVVGPARYQSTDVVVGVDERLELAIAYEANCREVARARLP